MKYNTLLFDVDDTLLDFQLAEKKALKKLFSEGKIDLTAEMISLYKRENTQLWHAHERGEISKQKLLDTRFSVFFNVLGKKVDGRLMDEKYRNYLSQKHDFLGNSQKIIHQLSNDYRLYLVTNGVAQVQHPRLKNANLTDFFHGIFISEEVGYQKPMLEYFEYVFAQIPNFEKKRTLLIGDSLHSDILGGNQAGIDTVWLNQQSIPNVDMIQPTYEINCLDELLSIVVS